MNILHMLGPIAASVGDVIEEAVDHVVTVASGTVGSDLTNYPLMVDLSDMPSTFWAAVEDDGGNVRAYESDGTTELPMDLTYIDSSREVGRLFIKTDLLAASDNEIVVRCRGTGSTPAVDSTYGRNAVWADYKAVYVFPETMNRTGVAYSQFMNNEARTDWLRVGFQRLSGNPHQGLTGDGTNFWTVDTNAIRKTDLAFATVASDTDVTTTLASAGLTGISHLGDPVVVGSYLYLTTTRPTGTGDNGYGRFLVRFNKSDLSYDSHVEITDSTNYVFGATVCYDGTDLLLFSYTNGSKFIKYNPTTLAYSGQVSLSTTYADIQGSTVLDDGTILFSVDNGNVYACNAAGAISGVAYHDPHGDIAEGLHWDTTGQKLYLLKGDGDMVALDRIDRKADWVKFHSADGTVTLDDLSTTWTMGGSAYWTDGDGDVQEGFVAYDGTSTGVSVMYDEGPDRVGIWNTTDGWLHTTADPAGYDTLRFAGQHVGTATRSVWVDGVRAHDAGPVVARPTGGTAAKFTINNQQAGASEDTGAYYQHVWLRYEALSDDWIEADAANWNTPASFYSIAAAV